MQNKESLYELMSFSQATLVSQARKAISNVCGRKAICELSSHESSATLLAYAVIAGGAAAYLQHECINDGLIHVFGGNGEKNHVLLPHNNVLLLSIDAVCTLVGCRSDNSDIAKHIDIDAAALLHAKSFPKVCSRTLRRLFILSLRPQTNKALKYFGPQIYHGESDAVLPVEQNVRCRFVRSLLSCMDCDEHEGEDENADSRSNVTDLRMTIPLLRKTVPQRCNSWRDWLWPFAWKQQRYQQQETYEERNVHADGIISELQHNNTDAEQGEVAHELSQSALDVFRDHRLFPETLLLLSAADVEDDDSVDNQLSTSGFNNEFEFIAAPPVPDDENGVLKKQRKMNNIGEFSIDIDPFINDLAFSRPFGLTEQELQRVARRKKRFDDAARKISSGARKDYTSFDIVKNFPTQAAAAAAVAKKHFKSFDFTAKLPRLLTTPWPDTGDSALQILLQAGNTNNHEVWSMLWTLARVRFFYPGNNNVTNKKTTNRNGRRHPLAKLFETSPMWLVEMFHFMSRDRQYYFHKSPSEAKQKVGEIAKTLQNR